MTAFKDQEQGIQEAIDLCVACLRKGNKILICGNGGSAADAQHIAGELVGRFKKERPGYAAIALTTDTSVMTSWANDYEYETIFARQVEALGKPGDVLIGLSTSGYSSNVLAAFKKAEALDMHCIAFTGKGGGKLKDMADVTIDVKSSDTPRIQECHMVAYHIICEELEKRMVA
mgnify:FL=1